MAEDFDIFKDIKTELDMDDEGFIVYHIVEEPTSIIYDKDEDPLLSRKPVVYTTKLDEMNILNQDLTKLNAKEILKKLHSESKPIKKTESNKHSLNSNSVESFNKLANIINDINSKVNSEMPRNAGLPLNVIDAFNQENMELIWSSENVESNTVAVTDDIGFKIKAQISANAVVPSNSSASSNTNIQESTLNSCNSENMEFNNVSVISDVHFKAKPQISINTTLDSNFSDNTGSHAKRNYKSCYVVLEDIKKYINANQTVTLESQDRIVKKVKQNIDSCILDADVDGDVSNETKISRKQNISTLCDSKAILSIGINSSPKQPQKQSTNTGTIRIENLKTKHNSALIVPPAHPMRKRKRRVIYDDTSHEDVPVTNLNKKSKTNDPVSNTTSDSLLKINNICSVSNIQKKSVPVSNDSAKLLFQEKYALIVLTCKEKETVEVYRTSTTKLVTDYYVLKNEYCDQYKKITSMYPKEEKIVEEYCCWYKRDQIISKICSRKNYPFSILKFLKLPHTCHLEECHCCCNIIKTNTTENKQLEKPVVINNALTVAEQWIQGLLNKNKSMTPGLVDRTLIYTPKPITEKPVENPSKKYLENYLLCLQNSSPNVEYELYEIGQNSTILRSLLLHKEKEIARIRKTYQQMSIPIKDAKLCCWFSREKLMHELKMLKTSPAILKYIQKAHSCVNQKCLCCCKPPLVTLKAIESLPSTYKQTTAYDINLRPLAIQFNAKSKNAILKASKHVATKNTSGSTIPSKNDNPDLSISILSKLKNLRLGINSEGTLEAILNGPAKMLSVPELKVLSDILALSTKQIVELGLSAEEFCNRVNSKTDDVVCVAAPECLVSNIEEIAQVPSPLQDRYGNEEVMEIEDEDTNGEVSILTSQTMLVSTIGSTITTTSQNLFKKTKPNEPLRKTPLPLTKTNTTKSVSSMFKSLSNLMEIKNKNYVESFKSFFKISNPSNFTVTNNDKCMSISKSDNASESISIEELPMPIIKETFTLAKSPDDTDAIPGPSGITQHQMLNVTKEDITVQKSTSKDTMVSCNRNQTKTKIKKPMKTSVRKINKKICVKTPSELNSSVIPVSYNSQQVNGQPTPIVANHGKQSLQQLLRPQQASNAVIIGPNQKYTATNHGNMAPNFKIVSYAPVAANKMNMINSNSIQVSAGATTNNTGICYLTFAPFQGHISGDTSNEAMFTKFLTAPQAQPVASSSCTVPPLVPIMFAGNPVIKEPSDQAQNQE